MKLAAVYAIAELISEEELHVNYVIPNPFDPRVVPHVAYAVARAAVETGVSRKISACLKLKQSIQVNKRGKYIKINIFLRKYYVVKVIYLVLSV